MEKNFLDRLLKFSVSVINLSNQLPKTPAGFAIASQFIRSGTSIGANVEEAQDASSAKDFIQRLSIALREEKDTMKKNSALKNSQFSILPPSSRLRRAGNSQLRSESGQALLEVLIALTTAVIIISAMTVIVITSLNNAQFSKHQNEATQYAQQGIEILKNQSQSDWSTFSSKNDINYCLSQSNDLTTRTGTGTSCGLNLGIFSREVTIYQSLDDLNNNCDPKP